MRRLLTLAFLVTLPLSAVSTHKKAAKKSSPHGVASKKRAPVASKPKIPSAPSSIRYTEIQDALIAKGYLKTPSNGIWDQDSQEAMRRFQADQKLDPTGKLTSRSLISLGLGPQP